MGERCDDKSPKLIHCELYIKASFNLIPLHKKSVLPIVAYDNRHFVTLRKWPQSSPDRHLLHRFLCHPSSSFDPDRQYLFQQLLEGLNVWPYAVFVGFAETTRLRLHVDYCWMMVIEQIQPENIPTWWWLTWQNHWRESTHSRKATERAGVELLLLLLIRSDSLLKAQVISDQTSWHLRGWETEINSRLAWGGGEEYLPAEAASF